MLLIALFAVPGFMLLAFGLVRGTVEPRLLPALLTIQASAESRWIIPVRTSLACNCFDLHHQIG